MTAATPDTLYNAGKAWSLRVQELLVCAPLQKMSAGCPGVATNLWHVHTRTAAEARIMPRSPTAWPSDPLGWRHAAAKCMPESDKTLPG